MVATRDRRFAAEQLIRAFAPSRVFDAGCGSGALVEALRDQGVAAFGRDDSLAALAEVRPDLRQHCRLGFLAGPLEGTYDLIVCAGVLEQVPDPSAAIRAFAAAAPRILFAPAPPGAPALARHSHAHWLALWHAAGFAPLLAHDASYFTPGACVLERPTADRQQVDLASFAALLAHRVELARAEAARFGDSVRAAVAGQVASLAAEASDASRRANAADVAATAANDEADALRDERDALRPGYDAALRRAEAAELACAQAEQNAAAARAEAMRAQAALAAVTGSIAWRNVERARRAAGVVPAPLRRRLRQGGRVLVWLASGQLVPRLRQDGATRARIQSVAASPLFDAAWYRARNADVAASGMDPARHFVLYGSAEGRDPGPGFSTGAYLDRHPEARGQPGGALVHALAHGTTGDGMTFAPSGMAAHPYDDSGAPAARDLIRAHFPYLVPLPVFAAPNNGTRRLTVVLDSLGADSLYGGVGTALILAALAALRLNASLRVVTRTQPAEPRNVGAVLRLHGIPWQGNIEFVFAPNEPKPDGQEVPLTPTDLILTTSWWSTWSTRQAVPRARIAYLLQEDERMFYPLGDDHLRCDETLRDPGIVYLVNSHLLLDHCREHGLAPGATAFEPAFPDQVYRRPAAAARKQSDRRGFFFYARPLNARNLYWRGLEALTAAIEEGVLDPAAWDFHFAGHGATKLTLPRGARALFPGPMPWPRYAAFVGGIDVGLSLMYTPHPSYPPLDLAATGAVVVTNRFGRKRELDSYSRNIVCVDPDVPSLVAGLRQAVALADDPVARAANAAGNFLQRDWAESMAPVLDRLVAWAVG